jgi:hypothetical protein
MGVDSGDLAVQVTGPVEQESTTAAEHSDEQTAGFEPGLPRLRSWWAQVRPVQQRTKKNCEYAGLAQLSITSISAR